MSGMYVGTFYYNGHAFHFLDHGYHCKIMSVVTICPGNINMNPSGKANVLRAFNRFTYNSYVVVQNCFMRLPNFKVIVLIPYSNLLKFSQFL